MKQKSPRHKWADDGGRETVIGIMKMNDTPQRVIDAFCALGLREQFNKADAICRMVAHPHFHNGGRFTRPALTNVMFSWKNLGQYTHFGD